MKTDISSADSALFRYCTILDLRVELPSLKKQAIVELVYGTNAKIIAGFHAKL